MCKLARHNQSIISHQRPARGLDTFLSIQGQRNVGGACMSPRKGPFGLAVSNDEASWSRCHLVRSGLGFRAKEDVSQK